MFADHTWTAKSIYLPKEISVSMTVRLTNTSGGLTIIPQTIQQYTGLFKMIVGVLTTCQTQYTWDRSMFFLFNRKHSKFLLHTLQVLYMCTLCDSTNINTIIEFVPHVSGDGFNGGSDSYLQFRIHTHPVSWNCTYHLRMELSDDGCFPNLVQNCQSF